MTPDRPSSSVLPSDVRRVELSASLSSHGRLVALAILFAALAGPNSVLAQTRNPPGMKPIHREALPAAALGVVLPLACVIPFRSWFHDPNADDPIAYTLSFSCANIGLGAAQTFAGAGIETWVARSLERRYELPHPGHAYGRAVLGQSIGWVTAILVALPTYVRVNNGHMPETDAEIRRAVIGMHVVPSLVQAFLGSYLGAFLLERGRPETPPTSTIAPSLGTWRGDPRSFVVGVGGTF